MIVATLLCVAITAVQGAKAINCDVTFPATTFQAPLLFNNPALQAWLVSPSAPSNNTPSGSTPCGYPSYFSQYAVDGAPYVCVPNTPTITPTATGCAWSMGLSRGAFGFNFLFNINCDPNANATIVPPAFFVVLPTPLFNYPGLTYWGNFTSKLVCADAPLFRIAKKP